MEFCNRCGMCCKAIMINKSADDVKQMVDNGSIGDAKFVNDNWNPINAESLMRINPYLYKGLVARMVEQMGERRLSFPVELIKAPMYDKLQWYSENKNKISNINNMYWYTCSKLVNNMCSVHETRPLVCRDYPAYGKILDVDREQFYDENCGYKTGIPYNEPISS